MMSCEEIKRLLPLALYGELSFEEEELFKTHLAQCEACQESMARQAELHHAIDEQEEAPSAVLLQQCRRTLLTEVAATRKPSSNSWWKNWWNGLDSLTWLARPAGALALVVFGFGLAKVTAPKTTVASFNDPKNPVAVRVRDVEPVEAGQIRIVIEESRERSLSGRMEDDQIRQLLLTAMREASDPGLRVESVDLLKNQTEVQDVRRALLTSLQHDDNAGVRLKALEGLRPFARDTEVQHALAQVLLHDGNSGVRTQAIDLLIQKKESSMVGVLQELLHREDNVYVRQRCQKALQDMHASTESF